jgi:hypothetical protein
MNFEEPLKFPFLTAHSSVFLHHPPPFQREKQNLVDSLLPKTSDRQEYANSKNISLIAHVPPCEPASCWRQSQSRPRSGRPGGSRPSTLRHGKSQRQPWTEAAMQSAEREHTPAPLATAFFRNTISTSAGPASADAASKRKPSTVAARASHARDAAIPRDENRVLLPPLGAREERNRAGMERKGWRQKSKHRLAVRGLREGRWRSSFPPRPGAA